MKNTYELIFIFNNQEQIFKSSLEKVKKVLKEKGAEIASEEDMRIRRLAYEISGHEEGHYYLFHLEAEPNSLREITSEFKLFEDIIRFLVIKKEYLKDRYAKKRKAS